MAIAEVGGGTQRATVEFAGAPGTLAFPANVASGSLLIVAGGCYQGSAAPTAVVVTDTRSTSYTTILGAVLSGQSRGFLAYGISPSAGACTVTVNPEGTSDTGSFSIDEFSGVVDPPLDVDGGSTTGTSTTPADALTTVTANDLLIGVMIHFSADTALAPTSGTQIGEIESNANQCHAASFQVVTTAQAYTVSWSAGASVVWAATTAAFKEVAGGGGLAIPVAMRQYRSRWG